MSKFIKITTNERSKELYLRGIVYFGGFHFVSQIIRKDDTV